MDEQRLQLSFELDGTTIEPRVVHCSADRIGIECAAAGLEHLEVLEIALHFPTTPHTLFVETTPLNIEPGRYDLLLEDLDAVERELYQEFLSKEPPEAEDRPRTVRQEALAPMIDFLLEDPSSPPGSSGIRDSELERTAETLMRKILARLPSSSQRKPSPSLASPGGEPPEAVDEHYQQVIAMIAGEEGGEEDPSSLDRLGEPMKEDWKEDWTSGELDLGSSPVPLSYDRPAQRPHSGTASAAPAEEMAWTDEGIDLGAEADALLADASVAPAEEIVWADEGMDLGAEADALLADAGAAPAEEMAWTDEGMDLGAEADALLADAGATPAEEATWADEGVDLGAEADALLADAGTAPAEEATWADEGMELGAEADALLADAGTAPADQRETFETWEDHGLGSDEPLDPHLELDAQLHGLLGDENESGWSEAAPAHENSEEHEGDWLSSDDASPAEDPLPPSDPASREELELHDPLSLPSDVEPVPPAPAEQDLDAEIAELLGGQAENEAVPPPPREQDLDAEIAELLGGQAENEAVPPPPREQDLDTEIAELLGGQAENEAVPPPPREQDLDTEIAELLGGQAENEAVPPPPAEPNLDAEIEALLSDPKEPRDPSTEVPSQHRDDPLIEDLVELASKDRSGPRTPPLDERAIDEQIRRTIEARMTSGATPKRAGVSSAVQRVKVILVGLLAVVLLAVILLGLRHFLSERSLLPGNTEQLEDLEELETEAVLPLPHEAKAESPEVSSDLPLGEQIAAELAAEDTLEPETDSPSKTGAVPARAEAPATGEVGLAGATSQAAVQESAGGEKLLELSIKTYKRYQAVTIPINGSSRNIWAEKLPDRVLLHLRGFTSALPANEYPVNSRKLGVVRVAEAGGEVSLSIEVRGTYRMRLKRTEGKEVEVRVW